MVSQTVQVAVDALTYAERVDLLEYLKISTAAQEESITDSQAQLVSRRAAEIRADSALGISLEELNRRLDEKWQ
ncbi:addiction module protein [Propionimicrobium sp. PCR01-08-3]|uniref:addiction module protein n=1 Tax=Propionimicrobium sp. PCR01-08-3 TaxID=3052086 RepID=UPI00255CAC75|nr:addiction module protein [Propionimicrobium sp. PCR01-08-3]WIY82339.1 addiction module protein [Propionimicrobium sp. PCR01-08-3]